MDEVFIRTLTLPEWLKEKYFSEKEFYSIDELIAIIEDLDADLSKMTEMYKDLLEDMQENYKFIGGGY